MKNLNGKRRDVTNPPTATIERFESHITTLNPGMISHPPHTHPQEEFINFLPGDARRVHQRFCAAGWNRFIAFFALNDPA